MAGTEADNKLGKLRIRASAVCVDRAQLLCVRLRDPKTGVARLFVPGGAIEPGETPAMAAAREVLEETGYEVEVDPASEVVAQYPYEWNGVLRQVRTHFFKARGPARVEDARSLPARVNDASYNEGVVWLPLEEIPTHLGFNDAICAAVLRLTR